MYMVFQKFDIIWDIHILSEKLILFPNLITWSILIQMISNFIECVEISQNCTFNI